MAFVEVSLLAPLASGELLVMDESLEELEHLTSGEEGLVWEAMIPAMPGDILWLVHETGDGRWSAMYEVEVP